MATSACTAIYRITDLAASQAFYEALGLELRRDLDIVRNGEREATNYFFGFPGQDEELELTLNHDGRTYDLGTGYGHIAIGVDDLDGTLARSPGRASSRSGRPTRFARVGRGFASSATRTVPDRDHRPFLAPVATRIVLLRGVNLGPSRRVRMEALRDAARGPRLRRGTDALAERQRRARQPVVPEAARDEPRAAARRRARLRGRRVRADDGRARSGARAKPARGHSHRSLAPPRHLPA